MIKKYMHNAIMYKLIFKKKYLNIYIWVPQQMLPFGQYVVCVDYMSAINKTFFFFSICLFVLKYNRNGVLFWYSV